MKQRRRRYFTQTEMAEVWDRWENVERQVLADINRLPPTYCAAATPTHKVTEFAPPLRKSDGVNYFVTEFRCQDQRAGCA